MVQQPIDEWKVLQEVYHRLNPQHEDDLKNFDIIMLKDKQEIIKHAIEYLYDNEKGFVYPSKSYIVAIVYADYISERWDINFFELLNDPDLLYGNDPFFVTYEQDSLTYDILVNEYLRSYKGGIVPDIFQWCRREFMDDRKEDYLGGL